MPPSANSAGALLQLFRTRRARTRNEVQTLTGLARSTVTYKIDSLLDAGYLVADGSIVDGRGRPSTRLRLNDHDTTVLAADLGATHGRLAVATAAGEVLAETVIESAIATGPDRGAEHRAQGVRPVAEALRTRPVEPAWHRAGGARTGELDDRSDRPLDQHAGLGRLPGARRARRALRAAGRGGQRRQPAGSRRAAADLSGAHLILFVKIGTGIGASVILDGGLLRGSDSAEGDIGHAKIIGVEETCSSCGARGCLAATASGRAMVRDLQRLGHHPETTRDVVALVRAGEPQAVGIVTAAGRALGDVLSTAVSLLNPDVVVIGGDIAHAHEHFLHGVRETLLGAQPAAGHGAPDHRVHRARRPRRHHRRHRHGGRRRLRPQRRRCGSRVTPR